MKRILFVMNDHEEVGKTSFATALTTHLRDQGLKTALISVVGDDDERDRNAKYNGTWNILDENNIKRLLNWTKKNDVVICDVQTGYAEPLLELHESIDMDLELGELDIELTIVAPQVDEADCNECILEIAQTIGDKAYYVIPRIPKDEFASSLESWEDSKACRAVDSLGAVTIEVPRITDAIAKLLESADLSVVEAMGTSPDDLPGDLGRYMRRWWREFDRQMEEAADYLIPEVVTRHGFRRSA
jgi:hypothetical protein